MKRTNDTGLKEKYHHTIGENGRGGMTVCELLPKDSPEPRAVGVAVCSVKDSYNRKLGRTIALGRALKALEQAGLEGGAMKRR